MGKRRHRTTKSLAQLVGGETSTGTQAHCFNPPRPQLPVVSRQQCYLSDTQGQGSPRSPPSSGCESGSEMREGPLQCPGFSGSSLGCLSLPQDSGAAARLPWGNPSSFCWALLGPSLSKLFQGTPGAHHLPFPALSLHEPISKAGKGHSQRPSMCQIPHGASSKLSSPAPAL